jgi:branched-chain amino acid transport system permease protein
MLAATIVGGITLGFLYGLVALTLILLVRTTGVLNFAAADIGMLCAFIAFSAIRYLQLPAFAALLLTLLFSAALGGAIYFVLMLGRRADPLILSLRTMGLMMIVRAVADKIWGGNAPYSFPQIFPAGGVEVFGLTVTFTQIMIIAMAIVVAVAVDIVTSATRLGLMLRAVSSDRVAAADLGVPVTRVDLMAWCMATIVAACVGMLVAQVNYLAPDMMAPILLAAFAAAQLGDMRSMRIAIIAGIALGIIQSVSSVYANQPVWSQVISFALLALGLVLRSRLQARIVSS